MPGACPESQQQQSLARRNAGAFEAPGLRSAKQIPHCVKNTTMHRSAGRKGRRWGSLRGDRILAMMSKLLLIVAGAASAFAQTPLVTNVGNFIHDVSDVDRSVHFYHDVLGMDSPRPAGDWQTTQGVVKMYDAEGGKFRVGNAQIPGSPMRMELRNSRAWSGRPSAGRGARREPPS